ncbi:hypothetical protein Ga0123462_0596 [Mariprofundus ferrinatatus]|uniref:Uncharacterized protein n=1 Tax=Mariprofundus ferrinatatus TaxID=1921087 RepID=A0A2K8LB39_9PROT|nr:hypothetical protein [Mariprofundus ferrinatatus]ATX81466.1 hypothetical protein Ga0123462_0596 [Mariprofundus ferrinatatus]
MKSLYEAFNLPVHFKLTQDGGRSLSFRVYPVVLLIVAVLLVVTVSVIIISALASDKQAYYLQEQQSRELQLKHEQLRKQSAETEALLSLSNAQIEAMKQELQRLVHKNSAMQKRLTMFDDVLAARKVKGVHLLRPSAAQQENNLISYNLILVKGDNYPRWAHGWLQFSILSADGNETVLLSPKGKDRVKFEMTGQEFIDGSLLGPNSWSPEQLIITVFNEKGKQTGRVTVPILGNVTAVTDANKESERD